MKVGELIKILTETQQPGAEIAVEVKCTCGGVVGYKRITTLNYEIRSIKDEYGNDSPKPFIYLQHSEK
jgi:hypothetical protein